MSHHYCLTNRTNISGLLSAYKLEYFGIGSPDSVRSQSPKQAATVLRCKDLLGD